jgi:hypothetical protein
MKKVILIVTSAALFGFGGVTIRGQEKPKNESQQENAARLFTTVKVHFLLSEFDGEKKVASLPYSFLMNTDKEKGMGNPIYRNFIRTGSRLSVSPDKDGKMQYMEIGSNIDCGLNSDDAGQYLMRFNFERTALAPPPTNDYDSRKGDPALNYAAIRLPTFRSTAIIPLKDGRPTEVMSAVDPLNGHTYTLTVTVTAQK